MKRMDANTILGLQRDAQVDAIGWDRCKRAFAAC